MLSLRVKLDDGHRTTGLDGLERQELDEALLAEMFDRNHRTTIARKRSRCMVSPNHERFSDLDSPGSS